MNDSSEVGPASGGLYANRSSSSPCPSEPVSPSSSSLTTEDAAPLFVLWSGLGYQTLHNPRRPTVAGWEALYWQHQEAACQAYDMAACALKVVLLLANVRRSLEHGMFGAALCAGAVAVLVALSLALMVLCQVQYRRYRRLVLWSNLVAISFMMTSSIPQFLSTSSSRLWGHQMLVLLFKMGVTWPIMAALMHRLHWQDTAALCFAFCTWLCLNWSRPLCNYIAADAGDAAFVTQLAGVLDMLMGLGTNIGAGRMDLGSSVSNSVSSSNLQVPGVGPAAVLGLGAANSGDNWAPVAQHITAACVSSSPSSLTGSSSNPSSSSSALSSSDCQSLLFGQCMALITTMTLWAGVCVISFFVVLAEEHSKWRWWHSTGARRFGPPPSRYAPTSTWTFLCNRLLYLHILLDVPLMVLWVGSTSWYRQPMQALEHFNLS